MKLKLKDRVQMISGNMYYTQARGQQGTIVEVYPNRNDHLCYLVVWDRPENELFLGENKEKYWYDDRHIKLADPSNNKEAKQRLKR